ncbi:hypothetical protein FFK22_022675 [Mycobacterium sp. KBS0706]|uniref:hypothetical protein n=1 Tax=Mycobacterium sp. KBS0706 TaxID=2578109 RepID=UPI00110F9F2D|nr:hypothetical protein [Mycobacterium sp. KBS0706]TSD86423.1 hypothetical protein FFK22_022675 [Mycobacterium sp. KBS0706]
MTSRMMLILAASVLAFGGTAKAADHLVTAQQHGLTTDSHAFATNPAGHSGDLAPGQGDPKVGENTQTPATDTPQANAHAQVKQR